MQEHEEQRLEAARRGELERRIGEISAAPDEAFGVIGRGELLLAALIFVVLPVLVVVALR